MTIKKFMMFDLLTLCVIAIIVDVVGYFASRSDLVFLYVALSIPVMLIAYIRWDIKALVLPGVTILLHVILYRDDHILATMVYLLSIASTAVSMIWFKVFKRNRIKEEFLLLSLYYVSGYALMFLFQAYASHLMGEIQWLTLLIRHSVNFILGWIILFIASKQEDLLVDMKGYLLRSIEERKKEEGR